MFTLGALTIGALAAFVIGLSKTGLPGGGLIAVPMIASVVDGRLIHGVTLPLLIAADLVAVRWYRHHARWDVLRPLRWWLALGFVGGIVFFVLVGAATRSLEVTIGVIVLAIVAIHLWRLRRGGPTRPAGPAATALAGGAGGFTTFVANAAGPIVNTYLAGLRIDKLEYLGTSAWLYLGLNVAKIPCYLALGAWSAGGAFFTPTGLAYDAVLLPAIGVGVVAGRVLVHRVPQEAFAVVVLVLSAAGAVRLIV